MFTFPVKTKRTIYLRAHKIDIPDQSECQTLVSQARIKTNAWTYFFRSLSLTHTQTHTHTRACICINEHLNVISPSLITLKQLLYHTPFFLWFFSLSATRIFFLSPLFPGSNTPYKIDTILFQIWNTTRRS